MSLFSGFRARLRAAVLRGAAARDLDDEIRFHVELETEKNVALGMHPAEARRVALAHFGGVQRVREEHRDVRPLRWLEDFVADTRLGLRVAARSPVLSAAAIVTLALGIGANTAIFSAVNALILQPLPFPQPDRLVMVTEENAERGWHHHYAALSNILDWQDNAPAFSSIAAYDYSAGGYLLTGRGDTRRLRLADVSENFFSTLGVRAAIGRTPLDGEYTDRGPTAVTLTHAAWGREFGADSAIVGQSIVLDGNAVVVVGVFPPGFSFPWENLDGFTALPVKMSEARTSPTYRRVHWVRAVGRLAPGATIESATTQLATVARRLEREYPETNRAMTTAVSPLQQFLMGDTRLALLVVFASTGILLFIACANVGNLMLVRATGRYRETAVRLALGAGRSRLARQVIAESLVVSAIGGALGLALAWAGTRALVVLQPDGLLRVHDIPVDGSIAAYAFAATLAAGLLFALVPCIWTWHRDPADTLKGGSRTGTGGRGARRLADWVVAGEIALALSMTVGAGLLVRTFIGITRMDPGFDTRGVVAASYSLPDLYRGRGAEWDAFSTVLLQRVRALPGVTHAAFAGVLPLRGPAGTSPFTIEGRPEADVTEEVTDLSVSPEYFSTMRVPLRRGRLFAASDNSKSQKVALINETFAKRYFAAENPIGRRISLKGGKTPVAFTVIGVVADGRDTALVEPAHIAIYESTLQSHTVQNLVVRVDGDPGSFVPSLRTVFHDLEPSLWVTIRPLDEIRDRSLARPRFFALLLVAFAVVGLVLSMVGVYGVLAQAARNRARETGIRIALGARATDVQWMFVHHGLRLAAAGLAVGAALAFVATRAMSALLFGVKPHDPVTFVVVGILLAATSAMAAWIPATRASREDPVVALRSD